MKLPKFLSKTKLMSGYQCPKAFYWSIHRKDLIPPVNEELQALFDQGQHVTEKAREYFSGGTLVDFPAYDFVGSLHRTRELLKDNVEVIFEAAFEYKGCYARADVIKYNPLTQRWNLIEVKSTTKVKDEHLDDVSLQSWIMANSGLPLESISIMHLNSECRFPDLKNLFTIADVTEKMREKYHAVSPKLNELFQVAKEENEPQINVGQQCTVPRDCQFKSICWKPLETEQATIFDVPGLKQKTWDLFAKGSYKLSDLDELDFENYFDDKQKKLAKLLMEKGRAVDKKGIEYSLKDWKFPLVFLDFETLNPAIPRLNGTGPFMQIPYQYSVHIWSSPESKDLIHKEFLYTDGGDPRAEIAKRLVEDCGTEGSVVAYYSKFESACLRILEESNTGFESRLHSIRDRLVDPLPILREFVYDWQFKESFSIKSVGPALLGKDYSYEELPIANGGEAQRSIEKLNFHKLSDDQAQRTREQLLSYCRLDTLVMVKLVKWLYVQAGILTNP